jgi:hypothetical protein
VADLKQALADRGLLASVALPPAVEALLTALQPNGVVAVGADVRGTAHLSVSRQALGLLALDLQPPGPSIPYHLLVGDDGSFRLWLIVSATPPAARIFAFAVGAAGAVLRPATVMHEGAEEFLVEAPGEVTLTGVAATLLIEGRPGSTATLGLTPTDGAPRGLITLGLDPPTVLLGGSGFGLELPDGITIDDTTAAAAPGQTVIAGQVQPTGADRADWTGVVARRARLFLPRGVPYLGARAVEAYVEVGSAPGSGVDIGLSFDADTAPGMPGLHVVIECRDPAASGLQDFVPTLVEVAMTLPLDGPPPSVGERPFAIAAGRPVVLRTRFTRQPGDPATRVTTAVESQGADGVVAVHAPEGGPGAQVVIAAAALATAIAADDPDAHADASGVVLHDLLLAAIGVTAFLQNQGSVVVHRVELASSGPGLPLGGPVKLLLDYSVDVLVEPISVGVLQVEMQAAQPMRVRNRNVGLAFDPHGDGLAKFKLDFSKSDFEIEDPGAWKVGTLDSLFDILGTRSGRGSLWFEVDLRFKLDLGPVMVNGATIRTTRGSDGWFATLHGLDVTLAVPGAISGRGALQLLQGGGFDAELDVTLVPLGLAAGATVLYKARDNGGWWLFIQIAADLPAPIPIASTGLGLFGVAGSLAINGRPSPPGPGQDPVDYQLRWDSSRPLKAFTFAADQLTIGVEAALGTVPDLGFSFSAKGGLFLTVPDVAIRGALMGRVLAPRMQTGDQPGGSDTGLAFTGVVAVGGGDGVTIGLRGTLLVPRLERAVMLLGAHFPPSDADDPHDWYIYLGADGYVNPAHPDGRAVGPARVTVLPDLMPASADAYLMQRGDGIERWPRGRPGSITITEGFVLCFGFGFQQTIGVRGVVWAEVHALLDVLLATRPLTLAGFGQAGGSLNLGPFSIGVDADLSFLVAENAAAFVHARLCGRIDLLFTDIEGCVEISVGSKPQRQVPPPDVHPLDDVRNGVPVGDLAFLIDDRFRRIGPLARDPQHVVSVWPDTLLHLCFAVSPTLRGGFGTPQFTEIDAYPSGLAAQPVGSDMLRYEFALSSLGLFDVTADPHGAGTLVPGPLSAAWQVGRDGDPGIRPQAGDLVLLTYRGDLWLDRLADAGEGLPWDPMDAAGRACEPVPDAAVGWAVGLGAAPSAGRLVLPADPLSPDPTASRFTATLETGCSQFPGVPLGPGVAATLPPPYSYRVPASMAVSPPVAVPGERSFHGTLDVGGVDGLGGQIIENVAALRPAEGIFDARLLLLYRSGVEFADPPRVAGDGRPWTPRSVMLPGGDSALRYAPPDGSVAVFTITVTWPPNGQLRLLGLGGVTQTARSAVSSRRNAHQAEAARQHAAAAAAPQQAGTPPGPAVRCLLEPGRLYRLDVDMTWSGFLYEQKEDGSIGLIAQQLDQDHYLPRGGGPAPMRRSYFFATTPRADAMSLPLSYGAPGYLALLHRQQDVFHPELLQRHLLGYTPGQSEQDRFFGDPLQAHFSAGHVTALAARYGFDLKLGLRQVDTPGADGDEQVLDPRWGPLLALSLLTLADRKRAELAATASCPVAPPGATLAAQRTLAPQAWYEVYVLATGAGGGGRLPGVTFRTSRWASPQEMLTALGFASPAGRPGGDVPVALPPASGAALADGSDADFEAALDALGLDGWPPADEPRTSVLWVPAPADTAGPPWRLAGLLVECPEPIDRPGRCGPAGGWVHSAAGDTPLNLWRSDRTRSRLLLLCPAPVTLAAPPDGTPRAALQLPDALLGKTVSGWLQLPLQPAFGGDP